MRLPFALAHARREFRSSRRRIGLYMGSITLGVAALVAINSFRGNLLASIGAEARQLLGADVRLDANVAFPAPVEALLDSARAEGARVARVTGVVSMALAPRTGTTRLVQLRGIEGGYPFYTDIRTTPAGAWARLSREAVLVVDPGLLLQLGIAIGDTLEIGGRRFAIAGTVENAPGDVGFRSALAPRVFLPATALRATGLLGFGSLADYEAYLRMPTPAVQERFVSRHRDMLRADRVDLDTAEGRARRMTAALGNLSKFLGLAGLAALLLGGVGVASAIHVFVKDRIATVAVLRCLGATQRAVFGAYLLQAALLGFLGAAAGVVLGIVLQAVLPGALGAFLPVDVPFAVDGGAVLAGLATGLWVALLFALIPLLQVRDVAPLQALRRDFEPPRRRFDLARAAAYVALAVSVAALGVWQAPSPRIGLAFTAALAVTGALLALTALALIRGTRRFFPGRARYVVRQGISNLFRPHNQTLAVTLALGFGIFLIATIYLVHGALLQRLHFGGDEPSANLLLFDMQPDQVAGVRGLFTARGLRLGDVTPIVPSRLQAINGRSVQQLLELPHGQRPEGWALRREYRNSYRDTLVAAEEIVAGKWWGRGATAPAGEPIPISVEEGLAEELRLRLGDRVTWDFHGVPIESTVASLRKVEWARFQPNFFVVFEPGGIEQAPQTMVALADVPREATRARLQADLARRYPNISALDLSLIQQTLHDILAKVSLAIRFLALFSVAAGAIVLVGAIATARYQRVRESALLKTLGATRRQIVQILVAEYAALGLLAGLAGTILAVAGAWALTRFFFHIPFRPPLLPLLGAWLGVAALAVAVGVLNSRDVLRRPPLAVLREE